MLLDITCNQLSSRAPGKVVNKPYNAHPISIYVSCFANLFGSFNQSIQTSTLVTVNLLKIWLHCFSCFHRGRHLIGQRESHSVWLITWWKLWVPWAVRASSAKLVRSPWKSWETRGNPSWGGFVCFVCLFVCLFVCVGNIVGILTCLGAQRFVMCWNQPK